MSRPDGRPGLRSRRTSRSSSGRAHRLSRHRDQRRRASRGASSFTTAAERDRAAAGLRAAIRRTSRIEPLDVPDEDWAARSQASLRAVHVGRLIVAPPWDAPVTIVVQPSMGFGTGHHATTRLCLAALQQLDLRGSTVIDVGTGSGVLAIAASLLGAANVIGIDDDADAVSAARDNLALNPRARVTLQVGDLRQAAPANADVVLANLTGALLVSAADRLQTADGSRRAPDPQWVHGGRGARCAARLRARSPSNTARRKRNGYASRFDDSCSAWLSSIVVTRTARRRRFHGRADGISARGVRRAAAAAREGAPARHADDVRRQRSPTAACASGRTTTSTI